MGTPRDLGETQNLWLNEITMKALEAFQHFESAPPVLVLSDIALHAAEWRRVLFNMGTLVKKPLPHTRGHEGGPRRISNVVLDFFVMSRAAGIIGSIPSRGGWSSFSA